MTERCDYCDRRFDKPCQGCQEARHPKPTLAQKIVEAIECDLNDRRGLGISTLGNDIQDTIRDRWTMLVEEILLS